MPGTLGSEQVFTPGTLAPTCLRCSLGWHQRAGLSFRAVSVPLPWEEVPHGDQNCAVGETVSWHLTPAGASQLRSDFLLPQGHPPP